jgi:hypothetical protein
MNWNLMVCFHQIYCGEDFPASKLCEVGNVPNGILVADSPSIQNTIVDTGSPTVFFLGDEVERRSPVAIETPSGDVSEHLELRFRDSDVIRC